MPSDQFSFNWEHLGVINKPRGHNTKVFSSFPTNFGQFLSNFDYDFVTFYCPRGL